MEVTATRRPGHRVQRWRDPGHPQSEGASRGRWGLWASGPGPDTGHACMAWARRPGRACRAVTSVSRRHSPAWLSHVEPGDNSGPWREGGTDRQTDTAEKKQKGILGSAQDGDTGHLPPPASATRASRGHPCLVSLLAPEAQRGFAGWGNGGRRLACSHKETWSPPNP
jgi:hypothetical protein